MIRMTLSLALLTIAVGCNPSSTDGTPAVDKNMVISNQETTQVAFNEAGLPTVSFDVPGMHCELMCVPKVRDALVVQFGVKDVQVDLDTKTATVAIEPGFSAEDAIAAIQAASEDFADTKLKEQPTEG